MGFYVLFGAGVAAFLFCHGFYAFIFNGTTICNTEWRFLPLNVPHFNENRWQTKSNANQTEQTTKRKSIKEKS